MMHTGVSMMKESMVSSEVEEIQNTLANLRAVPDLRIYFAKKTAQPDRIKRVTKSPNEDASGHAMLSRQGPQK